MANLTLVVDDELLQAARVRALREGTSVNALVRTWLEDWLNAEAAHAQATDDLLSLAAAHRAGVSAPWTRDELHER